MFSTKTKSVFFLSLFCLFSISCHGRLIPPTIDIKKLQQTNSGVLAGNNQFYPRHELHPPLQLLHEIKVSSAPQQKLLQVENVLFIPTKDGRMEVYDLTTGERIGKMKIPGGVHANILPLDENVLISLEFGKKSLFVMDPMDEDKLWIAELGSIKTIPVIYDDWIYVSSLYKGVFCINKSSGKIKWNKNLKSQLHANPLIVENRLIQGTDTGQLLALDMDDGEISWQIDYESPFFSSPIGVKGKIVVCSRNGTVACLTPEGDVVWERKFGVEFRRTPAASNQTIIIAGQDGVVRALDFENGSIQWQYKTGVIIGTAPLITSKYVVIGTLDKRLIFLSLDSGEERWQIELFGRIRTDPVLYGNKLIIGSENRFIYVFQSSDVTD